jgi:hypothetical protein
MASHAVVQTVPGASPDDLRAAGLKRPRWDQAYLEAEIELIRSFAPKFIALRLEAIDETRPLVPSTTRNPSCSGQPAARTRGDRCSIATTHTSTAKLGG